MQISHQFVAKNIKKSKYCSGRQLHLPTQKRGEKVSQAVSKVTVNSSWQCQQMAT